MSKSIVRELVEAVLVEMDYLTSPEDAGSPPGLHKYKAGQLVKHKNGSTHRVIDQLVLKSAPHIPLYHTRKVKDGKEYGPSYTKMPETSLA
jgi:hypothetical protein